MNRRIACASVVLVLSATVLWGSVTQGLFDELARISAFKAEVHVMGEQKPVAVSRRAVFRKGNGGEVGCLSVMEEDQPRFAFAVILMAGTHRQATNANLRAVRLTQSRNTGEMFPGEEDSYGHWDAATKSIKWYFISERGDCRIKSIWTLIDGTIHSTSCE